MRGICAALGAGAVGCAAAERAVPSTVKSARKAIANFIKSSSQFSPAWTLEARSGADNAAERQMKL